MVSSTLRQAIQERSEPVRFQPTAEPAACRPPGTETDVVEHGTIEQMHLLWYYAYYLTPRGGIQVGEGLGSLHRDPARFGLVEFLHQLAQQAFTSAAFAHDGNDLPALDGQRNTVQQLSVYQETERRSCSRSSRWKSGGGGDLSLFSGATFR